MLKKNSKTLLFSCLFSLFIASFASATEFTVFGPQDYEVNSLHLHLSRHSFSVTRPGDGYITITKNTPEQSINAGFLFFNRKFIPLGQFYRGEEIITYKNVYLRANNRITVFLLGTPGASVNIKLDNLDSPIPTPEITFTADPLSIIPADTSMLSWDVAHADLILIDNEIGYVDTQGSLEVHPLETTTYTLAAIGPGGNSTETITITVTLTPLTVEIFAVPETIILGESTTLNWNSTDADTCVIEPDINEVDPSGILTVEPTETTTYTIVATGLGGTATDEITVTVLNPEPIVEFSAEPETLILGESSTLSWDASYADACMIEPDIGSVAVDGSLAVTPDQTTTYTITATGPGGSAISQVTVTVYQPPTATISADPDSILLGESATLSWSTSHSNSIDIDQGLGPVAASGSMTISPTKTTTYTITATGSGGSVSDQTTVTVVETPQVGLVVSDSEIDYGETVFLSWSAEGYDSVYINDGDGVTEELPNGTQVLTPEYTTTYSLSATNADGPIYLTASVKVVGSPPEPQPEGSFGIQYEDLVPEDASLPAYDADLFIVLTGLVTDITGSPLADVTVQILNHPEYGTASTDETGRFSIPANGGDVLTIIYQKDGYISSQRKVDTGHNDIVVLETIAMIEPDPAATTFTFNDNPDTVITHQSTLVTDSYGSRSCSTVFTGDNKAYEVDANGNILNELTTITTRATEYTTPESMPAKLPPTSAYTYCVELSVDGAQNVRFEKPVTIWVDNFLGFNVGEVVPVGFYNRDKGVWEPSDNGVVVRLLDTNLDSIVDALDADGDDQPDDLNNDGSFLDEIQGLEDPHEYTAGATFWRAQTIHFTPCDLNFPYGTPDTATFANNIWPPSSDSDNNRNTSCNGPSISSYIEERGRIVHEDIPIPGTDIALHYTSSRVFGYDSVITVPASGSTVPDVLKRIDVSVQVAGVVLKQELPPEPDQVTEFFWDGHDYLGNPVQTPIPAHVQIGYVYDSVYFTPGDFDQAFAQPGIEATEIPARQEIILNTKSILVVQSASSKSSRDIAAGWTLSNHHHMNLQDLSTLHKGDGTVVFNNVRTMERFAGHGWGSSHPTEGVPALETSVSFPDQVAVDANGNVYIGQGYYGVIYKVDTSGILNYLTGRFQGWGFSGDGGPAIDARIRDCGDIAVDSNGDIYFSDTDNNCIRKIDTNGIINTIAGIPLSPGYSGDNGPATQAQLRQPTGVAADDIGNLYIVDTYYNAIRKIDPSGIITTIAGGNGCCDSDDGILAVDAKLWSPRAIAVDQAGNIYFTQASSEVKMIDTQGVITTFAGTGTNGFSGDGGLAKDARLHGPRDIAVDSVGNVYIADFSNSRIRMVDTNGIITTIAGTGSWACDAATGPAIQRTFREPTAVAVDDNGSIYVADDFCHMIKKISFPSSFTDTILAGSNVFSEENLQGHVISNIALHDKTVDLHTGIALNTFQYDENRHLISILDQFDNTITITRDENGVPLSITSPDGITTTLEVDQNKHLTRITYPDGVYYEFEYDSEGSMINKIEPEGNQFGHKFDENGRVSLVTDQEGGNWAYSKSRQANGKILTQVTSAKGNITSYLDLPDYTNALTSIITGPSGAETNYSRSDDGGFTTKTLPCGMQLSFKTDLDPEFRYEFIGEMTETTPVGLEKIIIKERQYVPDSVTGGFLSITETMDVNGKLTSIYDDLTSQKIITSPEGRITTLTYDPSNLLLNNIVVPGLLDTNFDYDASGKLIATTRGTRESTYDYNAEGFLASITDAENQTTVYTYDDVGQVTRIDRPDSTSLWLSYDDNGNMTILTNPNTIDHVFDYDMVNLNDGYSTPLSGSYSFEYDRDRQLTRISFPLGNQITNIYDATNIIQVQTPEGNIDYTYLCGDKVESVTNGTDTITYAYDGKLLTAETLSGTLNQSLDYVYNDDFNVTGFTYAGEATVYMYDDDGLLTSSGIFSVTRKTDNGLAESVNSTALNLNRIFNGYGEVDAESTSVNSLSISDYTLIRNNNGRITDKTETVAGITGDYDYTYDAMGRLQTVIKDGTLVEEYQYNDNGTRIYEMNTLRGIAGRNYSYSDEDHLLDAGGVTYQYDLDGFLTSKTDGADVTQYNYSSRGELLSITLPDGTMIEYVHDPLGRRIAKKVNGTTIEKYLWQGMTRLLAIYDGNDNALIRFEYADGRMPLAMTTAGVRYFLAYDQVGSLRVVANADGNVVKQTTYDSYGNIISDSDPSFNVPFGFAGGLHDRDTNLVRFGYRDYDPDIGRWTAKDPLFFDGQDTDIYGYVFNDPINSVDQYGLLSSGQIESLIQMGGGAVLIVGGALTGTVTGGLVMAGGITLFTQGAITAFIEWGLNGDTSDIPAWWWEWSYDIFSGATNNQANNCSTLSDAGYDYWQ
jgi:RHS repeat-associated protein